MHPQAGRPDAYKPIPPSVEWIGEQQKSGAGRFTVSYPPGQGTGRLGPGTTTVAAGLQGDT